MLEQLPRHGDGRVFHGPRGGALKPDVVRNVLIRELIKPLGKQFPTPADEIGFEHARVHSFRHYFVSQAFLNGASESEIREWVGHADSRIIERYRHLRDDEAQRRMEQISLLDSNTESDAQDAEKDTTKNQ